MTTRRGSTHSEEDALSKEGLVSIGTHNLYLSVKGPPRDLPHHLFPVVIAISGLGASMAYWGPVQRLLSSSVRFYCYDRSGLGRSEVSTQPRTAENMASELVRLLKAVDVKPPYVLIAHSYGSIIAREFLHLTQSQSRGENISTFFSATPNPVIGMVFIEGSIEHGLLNYPFPSESIRALTTGLDVTKVTGLTNIHMLTDDEWKAFLASTTQPNHQAVSAEEERNMIPSARTLYPRKQFRTPPDKGTLDPSPVLVIKGNNSDDLQKIHDAAVAFGNGTEEDRAKVLQMKDVLSEQDTKWQTQHYALSDNRRAIRIDEGGHNPHMTHPDIVADYVLRMVEEVRTTLSWI
ncbi:hypothetical protein MBLNU457_g3038t1 [Dothideomycetes sp. NU457]